MDNKKTLTDFILKRLNEYKKEGLMDPAIELGVDTAVYGREGFLNSLSLVTLIVDIEEFIDSNWGLEVVIADTRVYSQTVSPFKSVGKLAEYVLGLVEKNSSIKD